MTLPRLRRDQLLLLGLLALVVLVAAACAGAPDVVPGASRLAGDHGVAPPAARRRPSPAPTR